MRLQAEKWLEIERHRAPHAKEVTDYGDRIEIRRLWAHPVEAEAINLYAAAQVFVIEREVIPKGRNVKASTELCYAITSTPVHPGIRINGELLLKNFRGHWTVESGNHYRRDVTYGEDRSPVKNHNAARALAVMKMTAIFLSEIGAHKPRSDREKTLPELNRACAINGINRAINWMTRRYNPLG